MSQNILPNFPNTNNLCPYCHNALVITVRPAGGGAPAGFVPVSRHTMTSAVQSPWAASGPLQGDFAGVDYERRAPAREPSLQADVIVPAAQSILTGLALGVPGSAALGLLGYEFNQCLIAGGLLALAGAGVTWMTKLGLHSSLLWAIETVTGRDIDGDNQTGAPIGAVPVRVELAQGPRTRLVDLPIADDKLAAIADLVLTGGAFSRRALAGAGVSEAEYKALSDAMLAGGLLASKGNGNNAGVELTSAGRAVMRRVVVAGGGGAGRAESTTENTVGKGAGR